MHVLGLPEVHGISRSIKHKQPVWCPNDSVSGMGFVQGKIG